MPEPDPYTAIAQPIDDPYAAIAKPIGAQQTQPPEGAAARFGKSALSGFGVTSDEEAKDFFRHPLNTLQKILTGNRDLGNQAYKEIGKGNYSQGVPDLAYAAIPFLGSTLSKSAHQLTTGDYAGGLGTMTGAGAQVALGAKMAPGSKIAPTPEELSAQTLAATPKPQPAPVGGLRQSAATGMIQKLIKPMRNDVRFGKDPAAAIVREGLTANDLGGLGDQVYARTQQVGQQIDQVLQSPEAQRKTVDMSPSLAPIDEAMQSAVKNGNKAFYDRLGELKKQLTNDWGPDEETGSIKPVAVKNLKMTPYEATQFKRNVGDLTRWTGNDPFENDLNAVKGQIFGNVKDQVNQVVPEVKALNSRYADLVGAAKAIERRAPIAARNSEWSLSDIGTGIGALHYGGLIG